ncbi:MAG: hypothetical protein IPK79_05910 [Vampirovibrionales bacterium]|nr:hypothetical protein [Vampirovibrionales bacterium]
MAPIRPNLRYSKEMRSNVRPFPPRAAAGLDWRDRLGAVGFYLAFGALVFFQMGSGLPLNLFFLAAIFYGAFIHRGRLKWSYFLRFHFLQGCMLFFLLYWSISLILLLGKLVIASAAIFPVSLDFRQAVMTALIYSALAFQGIVALTSVFQAALALGGKTPRMPVVTSNVVFWA